MKNDKIKYYSEYLTELNIPVLKIQEIIKGISKIKNEVSVLGNYYKTYQEYIDIIDEIIHKFKIHDISGDIMNNNRISFDAYIFSKNDLEIIRDNIIDLSVSEFYINLPSKINIFGLNLNTINFIDKNELINVLKENISIDYVKNIITNIININFDNIYDEYYIWSNKNNNK